MNVSAAFERFIDEMAFDLSREHHGGSINWSRLRKRLVYAIPPVDYEAAESTDAGSCRVKTTPELETVTASCWVMPGYYHGALGCPLEDVDCRMAQMHVV
ncbi:hypothetical protein PTKU15_84560 [Paraburkholderia terrae]|nr:hypothetical protein PTKU15_84560 [Paraburkholderia terrae]